MSHKKNDTKIKAMNTIKNNIKNLYYSVRYSNFVGRVLYLRGLRVKIISTIIFIVLFFSICIVFELAYPRMMGNQINGLINELFWLGIK